MPTKAELEQRVKDLEQRMKEAADEVMVIDVGGGCREGRIDFIKEFLGEEFLPPQLSYTAEVTILDDFGYDYSPEDLIGASENVYLYLHPLGGSFEIAIEITAINNKEGNNNA